MPFLHERLRLRRKALKLTQKQIADRVGTSYQLIQQYERGINPRGKKVEPGAARLGELADALQTSSDYLLGRTDDPEPITMQDREWLREIRSAADQNLAFERLRQKMLQHSTNEEGIPGKKKRTNH